MPIYSLMESFFARLKVESIHAENLKGKREAYACVFEYIELFYNSIRRHSANDYKSPINYENNTMKSALNSVSTFCG